jgi:hypothetical protein
LVCIISIIYTPLLNIIGVTKSRWRSLVGHVACMEEKISAYRILAGQPDRKRLVGRLGIDRG